MALAHAHLRQKTSPETAGLIPYPQFTESSIQIAHKGRIIRRFSYICLSAVKSTVMKKFLLFFLVVLPLLLSCDKPVETFVIEPPVKPSGQQGQTDTDKPAGKDPDTPATPVTPTAPPSETVIVGYAVYWESTMPDPSLLTHINYAFAHIKSDFESLDIKKESRLSQIVALKKQKPSLKVLLSVGGWEAGNFSEMAARETHRKNFCKNCLDAVNRFGLDGIDIDWEYPTSSAAGISSSPEDTRNFTLLMRNLRETLGKDKLLTMASASNAKYVDFKEAVPYMDFVNVMTYDMGHPPRHNSALHRSSKASESCDESVDAHFAAGVPYEKIVLGIPFYGHGDGKAFDDYVDYKDIVIDESKYKVMWDNTAMVPYVVNSTGDMVLNFDNDRSVGLKAEFVIQKNLAGAMYWNIEADDASFTLGHAVASRLLPDYVPPTPPEDPDAILVTNPYVQKFLEEVTYTDTDYKTTRILDYPGGGPGEADIPPTHTITWTPSASAETLKVWESDWCREYSLPAGTASQGLTNLVPGREYHYSVTSGGKVIANGSFKTRGLLHQVFFEPNVRNARDLGGWKGLNGKTVVFRKIYRGGRLDGKYMNDKGKQEMRAEGIKAELDLREAEDVPSRSPLGSDITFYAPGFDSGYNHMVRDNQPKVKATFEYVVHCVREGKPLYFHCAAGRDRTGTLAVLILGTLGVSESDMAKDYELTYFSPADWGMSKDDDGNPVYKHTRNNYSYPSIRKTIFNETDGGTYQERIVKYLLKIGVAQKDIDDLRALMLE